jgi:hypothetical protein
MIAGVILTRLAANVAAYRRDRSVPIGPMRNTPDIRGFKGTSHCWIECK